MHLGVISLLFGISMGKKSEFLVFGWVAILRSGGRNCGILPKRLHTTKQLVFMSFTHMYTHMHSSSSSSIYSGKHRKYPYYSTCIRDV